MGKILRHPGSQLARLRRGWIRFEGDKIKGAQTHANFQLGSFRADAGHNIAKEARAIFQRAAVGPRTSMGREKFVQQIAVAMFDIDEVRSNVRRHPGRGDVIVR